MRHTADGILTHVDGTSVAAIGYLPQDIVGKSIMDFYHPSDMALMKDIYETVALNSVKESKLWRSKPYRFQIQNGCYITLETEWTSILNQWSHQMEFVIGHNRVLQGNTRIAYFVFKFTKIVFVFLLNLTGPTRLDIFSYAQVAEFPANLMESSKHYRNEIMLSLAKPMPNNFWNKGPDTVALGAISPSHEHDEKSRTSSVTPPSYSQLNYHCNMNRYFNSNPMTSGDCDGAIAIFKNVSDDGCQAQSMPNQCLASTSSSNTGTADSDSYEPLDSTDTSSAGEKALTELTIELLEKHNDAMEQNMMKQFKETRNSSRAVDTLKRPIELEAGVQALHGVKRCGSQSYFDEQQQNIKKMHLNYELMKADYTTIAAATTAMNAQLNRLTMANVPFGAPHTVPHLFHAQSTQPNVVHMASETGLYSTVYYVPAMSAGQNRSPNMLSAPMPAIQFAPATMPGLMHSQPPILGQPLLYQSPRFMYPSMQLQRKNSLNM